jgi:protein translocase SecG subunit
MLNILLGAQIIVSLFLLIAILVQVKGTGLGRVWGTWNSSFSRRGIEMLIFRFTFVLAFLFILISSLALIIT